MTEKIIKRITKTPDSEEILLGIDYGEHKIGLAFGRSDVVMPIKIVNAKDRDSAIKEIIQIAKTNHVTKLVIGLPLSFDKKENLQSKTVRQFTKLLNHYLKLPFEFIDEYGTSDDAQGYLVLSGTTKNRRDMDDAIAAALILKRYYNNKA
jgi:putative Holliday junction resolvase